MSLLTSIIGAVQQQAGGGGPIAESFNKADGVLGPDQPWTVTSGTLEVATNRAAATAGGYAEARAEVDLGSATDQWAECTAHRDGASSNSDTVRLLLRMASTDRAHYMAVLRGDDRVVFARRTAAGSYEGLTGNGTAATWVDGDRFRFEIEGSTLRAYINDVLADSTTDSDIASGPRSGIALQSTTCELDDFEAGAL